MGPLDPNLLGSLFALGGQQQTPSIDPNLGIPSGQTDTMRGNPQSAMMAKIGPALLGSLTHQPAAAPQPMMHPQMGGHMGGAPVMNLGFLGGMKPPFKIGGMLG